MNKKLELLRAISKMEMTSKDIELFLDATNQKQIDEEFLFLVCSHKLHNLLFKHIVSFKKLFDIKKSIAFILNERFVFTQNRAAEYFDLIKRIVPLLNKNNISYAFLKGISIANDLYCCDGLVYRSFNDIDILISKEQTIRLNEILESLGFIQGTIDNNYQLAKIDRKQKIYWSLNTHQEHKYLKASSFSGYTPGLYNNLDVNTTIFRGGKEEDPLSTYELLSHIRVNHSLDNIEFNSLDYTYELIQLCIHLYKDTFFYEIKRKQNEDYSLMQFCDIREFLIKHKQKLNWLEFLHIININDIGNYIYIALSLIQNFYGDLYLQEILEEIKHKPDELEMPDWEKVLLK